MRVLRIEREARQDAGDAADYYDSARAGLGAEFLTELNDVLLRILENPAQYPVFHRRARKTRLARFPYLGLYWFDDEAIHVVAVVDSRRNPKWIERRVP